MEENISKEQDDRNLHPERYDEALFRRAYKAGLELRKLNEKERKKKILIQIILVISFFVLVPISIHYFTSKESSNFLSPQVIQQDTSFRLKEPSYIYNLKLTKLDVSAKSVVVFDPDTGEIFFEKDSNAKRQIASLTKLVPSIIVMENMNLSDVITVKEIPQYGEEKIWSMELKAGDMITVENLIKMMLVSSYNDGAIVLAESLGSEKFISLMNEKASLLGLENSHFSNPCGFDNIQNYSTVDDLRKIVTAFLNYPTLLNIVDDLSVEVEYIREGETEKKMIYTTNAMLKNKYVKGIKTGYTEDAGECLISLYEYEDGSRLVIILLNSEDRNKDTQDIEKAIEDLKKNP